MNDLMKEDNRASRWLTQLKKEGYRLTGARCAVVEVIAGTEVALDASEILMIASRNYPSIGIVSVYRTIAMLEQMKLIQRIHQPDKCQAYISAFTSHEHLILCNRCGRVEFFSGDDMEDLVKKVESESKYQVHGHWLQFFGICNQCQELDPPANQ
jgi:Fur family transcriptional regulator, ferric uptake regulator